MANRNLFGGRSARRRVPAPTAHRNDAGGLAYKFEDKHALAQYVVTGTFANKFYASGREQLDRVKTLVEKIDDSWFLAQLAVYGSREAKMKDTPVFILAALAARGETELVEGIFPLVINNGKKLSSFVQIVRSGQLGRRSFGTAIKRAIQRHLLENDPMRVYNQSIGMDPSVEDIIKMVHPRPKTKAQAATFAYILGARLDHNNRLVLRGRDTGYHYNDLPNDLKLLEMHKAGEGTGYALPDVDFRVLTNLPLTVDQWRERMLEMPWNALRMNLNNFARKGVFNDRDFTLRIAERLADRDNVLKYNVFPYELMVAYQNTTDLPFEIRNALQDALEHSTSNVPAIAGEVAICVDVSHSMRDPLMGRNGKPIGRTRCLDVAALMASCLLRNNPRSRVVLFNADNSRYGYGTRTVVPPQYNSARKAGAWYIDLNPRDSVMTNAEAIKAQSGGGTDLSMPFRLLNHDAFRGQSVINLSDNESWRGMALGAASEWESYKARNRGARLVNIDLEPNDNAQVRDGRDVLNVGGFSDSVFKVVTAFLNGEIDNFVQTIESVELPVEYELVYE